MQNKKNLSSHQIQDMKGLFLFTYNTSPLSLFTNITKNIQIFYTTYLSSSPTGLNWFKSSTDLYLIYQL